MKRRLSFIFNMNYKKKVFFLLWIILIPLLIMKNFCAVFIIGVLLCFSVLLIMNYIFIYRLSKKISIRELETIEKEIHNPLYIQKNKYILTNHYIIIQQMMYIGIVKYEDIVLAFKRKLYNGVSFSNGLTLITKENKRFEVILNYYYYFISLFSQEQVTEVEKIIRLKNTQVLFGYNKKNITQIEDQYGFTVKR